MDTTVNVNSAIVVCVIIVEVAWYILSQRFPWSGSIDCFFITASICDSVLFVLLGTLLDYMNTEVSLGKAILLSALLALMFFCLEAPHVVNSINKLVYCLMCSLHKFCLILVMIVYLVHFKTKR